MKILQNSYILFIAVLVFASSCSSDDPHPPHQEELITTVIYTLTPIQGGSDIVFIWKDLDGDGSGQPEITNGTLAVNTEYTGAIQFLNELESPADNITNEVEEEGDAHEVFYLSADGLNLMSTVTDTDNGGNRLGLTTYVQVSAVSSGDLRIVLRHEPNKPNDGTLSGAGGETDIDVTFTVTIQ